MLGLRGHRGGRRIGGPYGRAGPGRGDRNPAVRLASHEFNKGYGQALRTGFTAARFDFVFFTDSDNQFDMEELPLLLTWTDRCDVVAGYRKVRNDPPVRKLNAWCWNRLVRLLFCVPVRDVDCAFKVFRRSALSGLDIQSPGRHDQHRDHGQADPLGVVGGRGRRHPPAPDGRDAPGGQAPGRAPGAHGGDGHVPRALPGCPPVHRGAVPSHRTDNGRSVDPEAAEPSSPDEDELGVPVSRDGVAQVA